MTLLHTLCVDCKPWQILRLRIYRRVTLLTFAAKATYEAMAKTYSYLTPDLWKDNKLDASPYSEFSEDLSRGMKKTVI